MRTHRARWGLSGLLGAATAVGIGELLAGLSAGIPSPLAAVGGVVVDHSPGWLKEFAIATFGTADKTALVFGTVVLAAAIGWLAGAVSRGRGAAMGLVFGGFGALGAWAASGEPGAEPVLVIGATAVAVAAGIGGVGGLAGVPT